MKRLRKTSSFVLVGLLAATIYGLIRTGDDSGIPAANSVATAEQTALVDQTPFLTAQGLAHMQTSPAELPFAQQALQLGDREMDLAFALAVLDATQHPPALTAEAKKIQARLMQGENALAAEQAHVTQLTAAADKASGAQKDALGDQLDLAKATRDLDQDEVDDAKQDLIRAGGDPQDRIQELVQEHEEASKVSDTSKVAVHSPIEPRGLIETFQQWLALHQKQLALWRARQEATTAETAFAMKHASLAGRIRSPNEKSADAKAPGSAASTPAPSGNSLSREDSAAMLGAVKRRADDRKTLLTLDERMGDEKQLGDLYGKWIGVVAAEQRALVNRGLSGVLIILAIAAMGLFVDGWIGRLLEKMRLEYRQTATLRAATRVALQIAGVLLVLLVIFGRPTQLGTFLGLAGAGLTVALQDFIIAFFGWFMLMGKNGIRLGDWVEINGVTGEVAEIGMFHTVLLETGNWADSGNPTGRRVTFTNSFAIQGHYFNFSTSGQWLWDELQVVLPAGHTPYPIVEALQKKVLEATSESARQAEQEWRGASKSADLTPLSAAPAINVKPVIGGTQLSVRYITRASERAELRAKLNRAAVDLLGAEMAPKPDADSAKPVLKSS